MRTSFLISLVLFLALSVCNGGQLKKHFYADTCPPAEEIVRSITWERVATNSSLPAKFLRMHFHDCFVRVYITRINQFMWSFLDYDRDLNTSRYDIFIITCLCVLCIIPLYIYNLNGITCDDSYCNFFININWCDWCWTSSL